MSQRRHAARPDKEPWLVRLLAPERGTTLFQQLDMLFRLPQWHVVLDWLPMQPCALGRQPRPDALQLRCLPRRQRRQRGPG